MDIEEIHQFIAVASLRSSSAATSTLTTSPTYTRVNDPRLLCSAHEQCVEYGFVLSCVFHWIPAMQIWREWETRSPVSNATLPRTFCHEFIRRCLHRTYHSHSWEWSWWYLEEEDTKHVNDGGGHGKKVALLLLANVCFIHQIFNLVSMSMMARWTKWYSPDKSSQWQLPAWACV